MLKPHPSPRRIPTTIVAGYLGAGKTTRINGLLRGAQSERIAVLVNDFGEVNIDAELIRAQLGTGGESGRVLELSNGCVCCQIGDDLGRAIEQVLVLDPAAERILIEASGVAEPARVEALCRSWAQLDPLDSVVVVDGSRVRRLAADKYVGELVRRQLAQAGRLLIREPSSSAGREGDEELRAWLRQTNRGCAISWGGELLATSGAAGTTVQASNDASQGAESWWRRAGRANEVDPEAWLSWWRRRPERVQRAKGFVLLQGESSPRLLQATTEGLELVWLAPQEVTVGGPSPRCEVVVIASSRGADADGRSRFDAWSAEMLIGPASPT